MLRTNLRKYTDSKQSVLINPEYYGVFKEFIINDEMTIYPKDINKVNIMPDYIDGLMNLFKDGIEQEFEHNARVIVKWTDSIYCKMNLYDLFFNLVMWKMLVELDATIQPYNIFISENITSDTIKSWIDINVIEVYLDKKDPMILNRTIYNAYKHLQDIDAFAEYLASTFNYFDFVALYKLCPEAKAIRDKDYSNIPIVDINDVGMAETEKLIDIIKNKSKDYLGYEHCCAPALRAEAGISTRQFKEFAVNIGIKPDGMGGIYPYSINSSFIDKGLSNPESMFVESASAGRYAQIISKTNVATSGAFARILGLNNVDTWLHPDPNYTCDTKNFVEITISNAWIFQRFIGRYYRDTPEGEDKVIRRSDKDDIIGRKIYLRDPMTCQSKTTGHGICYKCYGKLAYTNRYISIGKIAAEILSAILTQRFLSAKHILTAKPIKVVFGEDFARFFQNEESIISLNEDLEIDRKMYIKIDLDNISSNVSDDAEDDEAASIMTEFISEFVIETDGIDIPMHSVNYDDLFFTSEFTEIINRHKTIIDDEGAEIKRIPLSDLAGVPLFLVPITNSELSKALTKVKHIINLSKITSSFTKDEILQEFMEALYEGGLKVHSSHASILLSNMIRSKEDILETPDWSVPNQKDYQILAVSSALKNNPSVTVTLMYQGLRRTLINPITYRKHKPSQIDNYFMLQPQNIGKDESFVDVSDKKVLGVEDIFVDTPKPNKKKKVITTDELFVKK